MKSNLHLLSRSIKLSLLLFSSLLIFNDSYSQTAFTVSWPYTNTLNPTTTGNVSASAASMTFGATSGTPKTFYSQTNTGGFLTSVGLGGIIASASNNTYNAAGSSTTGGIQNIIPLEYSFSANSGNDMSVNSFTFSVEAATFVSGTSISAGYSIDNGVTFTGLATPAVTGGGTANASPTGSIVLAIGNKFTFTVPACSIPDGGVFKLRVFVWRNNSSGSSSSSLKFSSPSITGTTTPYSGPSINASTTILSNYNTLTTAASSSQFITLSGIRLDNDILIGSSATSDATGSSVGSSSKYEMSIDNINWQKTKITLPKTGTSLADTRLYFRLASGNTQSVNSNSQDESIIISTFRTGGSIIQRTIALSGVVNGLYTYADANNDITAVASWKNAANASPSNFTSAYQIFNLATSKTLTGALAISGTGSRLSVGNTSTGGLTFTIPTSSAYTGTIDIAAAQSGTNSVIFNNATLPTLGTIDATSTIVINNDYSAITTGLTSIGNLVINTGGKLKLETVTINGNLNITGDGRLLLNNASSGRSLTLLGNLNIDASNSGIGGIVSTSVTSAATSYNFIFGGLNKTFLSTVATGTQSGTTYADKGNDFTKLNITFASGSKYKLLSNLNYDFAGSARKITINSTDALDLNGFIINQNLGLIVYSAGGDTKIAPMPYKDLQITDGTTATNAVFTGITKIYGNLILSGASYITSNDFLTFGSNSTNTGVLSATSTASNLITGKVIMEKYIGNQRGWYVMGNPFSSTILSDEIGKNSTTPFDMTYSSNKKAIKSSVKLYNSALNTWSDITDSTKAISSADGFAIFVRGTSGEGANAIYTNTPSNVTLSLKGNLMMSQVVKSKANEYYVIDNPYPAPISIASILATNSNLSKKIAVYDPNSNSNSNPKIKAGNYLTYDLTGINKGDANDIVIPNLGSFIVKATSDGDITINNTAITSTNLNSNTLIYTSNTSGVTESFSADPGLDPDYCYLSSGLIPTLADINIPGSINAKKNKITLTNTTKGGTWLSRDTAIAIIDPTSGLMSGNAQGNAIIDYIINPTNGCNNFTTATIQIGSPETPLVSVNGNTSFCQGQSTTLVSDEKTNIQWYLNDTLITGATNTSYIANKEGKYTIVKIAANNTTLKSSAISIQVYQLPAAPKVIDLTYCNFATTSKLFATPSVLANTIKWYSDSTSSVALADAPTPSSAIPGTYKFYTTQTVPVGCESIKTVLNVLINALPAEPVVSDVNYCNNFPTSPLTAKLLGTTYSAKWYNLATGGTSITTPTPSSATVGLVKYYVTQTYSVTGCESPRALLNVNTYAIPSPSIISKEPSGNLNASSGTTFQWYKDNIVITGATSKSYAPSSDGKYSNIISINGCFSAMSDTYDFINTINKQDGEIINVGPNPFRNYIQLNYNIPSVKTVTISLFLLTNSTKVFEMKDVLPTAQVPINNLAPGIYMVQITSDDNRIVEKYKMIKL